MNVATLRTLDRLGGGLACRLLTLHRRVWGDRHERRERVPPRLLFVKLAEQGATVQAIPAIRAAVERVGRDNVFFLVFEENRFILDILELVPARNIVTIRAGTPFGVFWWALRALLCLRREGIDTAIDLEFFARSTAVLCYLSGARVRVGLHAYRGEGPYRGDLMTHRVRHNPQLHASQGFRLLVEALDASRAGLPALNRVPDPPLKTYPSFEPTTGESDEVFERLGLGTGPLVVLHPNPDDVLPLRRWPLPRYVEVACRLLEVDPHLTVAFTGLAGEAEEIERAVERVGSDRCSNLAGRTTLRELLVLLTRAEVLVTNDCGAAHFSALTPVHTVALFGPESPRVFGALGPRHHLLWSGIGCSPCLNAYNDRQSACRDNLCLLRIGVDEVARAVWAARASRRGSGVGGGG